MTLITNKRNLQVNGYSYALLVVFRSEVYEAPAEEWTPIKKEDLPREVDSPDVMAALKSGMAAFVNGMWYRAEAL